MVEKKFMASHKKEEANEIKEIVPQIEEKS